LLVGERRIVVVAAADVIAVVDEIAGVDFVDDRHLAHHPPSCEEQAPKRWIVMVFFTISDCIKFRQYGAVHEEFSSRSEGH
jgi:hypothetical protein